MVYFLWMALVVFWSVLAYAPLFSKSTPRFMDILPIAPDDKTGIDPNACFERGFDIDGLINGNFSALRLVASTDSLPGKTIYYDWDKKIREALPLSLTPESF
jgi:hypothetical protein